MKALVVLLALALTTGCASQRPPQVYYGSQSAPAPGTSAATVPVAKVATTPLPMSKPQLFPVDDATHYLLDPTSRSCTLVRWFPVGGLPGHMVAVPVDCATLAANSRDLAAILFWVRAPAAAPTSATPPVAPTTP